MAQYKYDGEGIGPGGISYRRYVVADGTAKPEEARELIEEFVRQATVSSHNMNPALVEHVRDCFAAFLSGKRLLDPAPRKGRDRQVGILIQTLDKAFGISRVAAGGPAIDEDTLAEVALEVLERRMAGDSFQEAAASVAEARKDKGLPVSSDSQVRAAWSSHQFDGFLLLRISKTKGVELSPPWTAVDEERLNQIFWGKIWWCPPGADVKARQTAILAEVDCPDPNNDRKQRVAAVIARIDGPFKPVKSRTKSAPKNSPKKSA